MGDVFDEVSPDAEDMEEEWPPFRKTGIFDPYSDDPRLALFLKLFKLLEIYMYKIHHRNQTTIIIIYF